VSSRERCPEVHTANPLIHRVVLSLRTVRWTTPVGCE
jgi:hypothetical protein